MQLQSKNPTQQPTQHPTQAQHPAHLLTTTSDFNLIRVHGPDSVRFLQGQLSCNVTSVTAGQTARGALCNLKGRVISDLRVLADADQLYLQTTGDMANLILNTLAKYKVFFKTDLTDVSQQYELLTLATRDPEQLTTIIKTKLPPERDQGTAIAGAFITRLADADDGYARFEIILNRDLESAGKIRDALADCCQPMSPDYWRLADISSGIAHIRPGMEERFTPQVLNYDIGGVVDFKKGCYTGQEVVARMYYRAEAKKRLGRLSLQSDEQLAAYDVDPDNDLVDVVTREDGSQEILLVASTNPDSRHPRITLCN